jgi:RND superfamily putative drug exporter
MLLDMQPPSSAPPGALARLGALIVRRRVSVALAYAVVLIAVAVLGLQVFPQLQSEGFFDPGSESAQAERILEEKFGAESPSVVLAIETPDLEDPAATTAARALVDRIEGSPGVERVVSYWTSGRPDQLRGADDRTGEVLVYTTAGADDEAIAADLQRTIGGEQGDLIVYVGGGGAVGNAISTTISSDLLKAESIAVPITIILLLFVFGSIVAAGLPFLVALGAVFGSFFALLVMTQVADVSIFAINLVTGLGLALGIDYALLMINRFREELAGGATTEAAVITMMSTAGKTVLVSGITVAVTLASLLVFPLYFLKSFAYAGIAVSLLAVLGALTALPAILALLGPHVNRLKVRRGDLAPRDTGWWSWIAATVMRRPWPVLLVVAVGLLVIAYPATHVVVGQVDSRALPADHPAAVATSVLSERFPGQEEAPYDVVLQQPGDPAAIDDYASRLSLIPEVVGVRTPTSIIAGGRIVAPNPDGAGSVRGDTTVLKVIADVLPRDAAGVAVVEALRATTAPAEQVLVGGIAAEYADSIASIIDRVWLVALWIAIATMLIVFLYTGSVLIPIKALLLNALGLAATLGALVWVFQDGRLQWLTGGYVVTGTIDITSLALITVVAFALSMDYELVLLSRIKEEHDAGRSTTDAVAFGLQRTGRIVTAAALLIAIVFAAFLTSGVTNIKQLGFGVAFAILVDATIVRGLLVPAVMRIAGGANWWSPAWLRRLHRRIGISDS